MEHHEHPPDDNYIGILELEFKNGVGSITVNTNRYVFCPIGGTVKTDNLYELRSIIGTEAKGIKKFRMSDTAEAIIFALRSAIKHEARSNK